MGNYKLITLTGPDRCGKRTQAKLLQHALQPSVAMSFPEYAQEDGSGHWAGEFVRAALRGEQIKLERGIWTELPNMRRWDERGPRHTATPTKANPYVFQMWQSVDRLDKQPWINETLKTHHIVADRYEVDAFAYGLVDGCSVGFLMELDALYRPSDLAIALIGPSYPRPGEEPDVNERDEALQEKIRAEYRSLAESRMLGDRLAILDLNPWQVYAAKEYPIDDARGVHRLICSLIYERLGLKIEPLDYNEVKRLLPELAARENSG